MVLKQMCMLHHFTKMRRFNYIVFLNGEIVGQGQFCTPKHSAENRIRYLIHNAYGWKTKGYTWKLEQV